MFVKDLMQYEQKSVRMVGYLICIKVKMPMELLLTRMAFILIINQVILISLVMSLNLINFAKEE